MLLGSAGVFSLLTQVFPHHIALITPLAVAATGLALFKTLESGRFDGVSLREILLLSIAVKAILFTANPVLENDYYRYLWDGRVAAHGINPYALPPSAEELIPLETDYWIEIAFKDVRTIYPPADQILFFLNHRLVGDSVTAWRLCVFLLDLILSLVVIAAVRTSGSPSRAAAAVLLHPLLLHEFAVTAHVDVLAVLALATLLAIAHRGHPAVTGGVMALLIASKYQGALIAPFFLFSLERRHRFAAIGMMTLCLGVFFLPYVSAGSRLFEGLLVFSRHWEFNGIGYQTAKSVFTWAGVNNPGLAARATAGAVFLAIYARILRLYGTKRLDRIDGILSSITALLLLSPVANPWYFTWLVPILALRMNRALFVLTITVPFSYLYFDFGSSALPVAFLLSYGPALFALLRDRARVEQ